MFEYFDVFGKEVKHTYKLFVIDASLNTNGYDLRAAKEVTLTPAYKKVEGETYQTVTLTGSGLTKDIDYNYWLFDITYQEDGKPAVYIDYGTF